MSGPSAVPAVIYAGTAQSLNGLARDLLACGSVYTKAVIRVVPALVSSLRVVAGLRRLLSFPANSKLVCLNHFCQAYLHMHKILLVHQGRHY